MIRPYSTLVVTTFGLLLNLSLLTGSASAEYTLLGGQTPITSSQISPLCNYKLQIISAAQEVNTFFDVSRVAVVNQTDVLLSAAITPQDFTDLAWAELLDGKRALRGPGAARKNSSGYYLSLYIDQAGISHGTVDTILPRNISGFQVHAYFKDPTSVKIYRNCK